MTSNRPICPAQRFLVLMVTVLVRIAGRHSFPRIAGGCLPGSFPPMVESPLMGRGMRQRK